MTAIEKPLKTLELGIGVDGQDSPFINATLLPFGLDYGAFNAPLLRQLAPEQVTSWLFCDAYDAFDIARILSEAGFEGRYTALAAHLPKKELVRREVLACFPALRFDIMCPSKVTGAAASYHKAMAQPPAYVDERPGLALA